MLPKKVWQDALAVQDACNLSGVVKDLARVVDLLWVEARALGLGTGFVNQHPIIVLYVDKLAALARCQYNTDVLSKAYDEVHKAIEAKE